MRTHVLSLIACAGLLAGSAERSFDELKQDYAEATDSARRMAVLEQLAQAGAREGVGDGEIARALAAGLDDEDFEVRGRAAELLGALDADQVLPLLEAPVRDLARLSEEVAATSLRVAPLDESAPLGEELERLVAASDRALAAIEAMPRIRRLRDRYAAVLGAWPDPRSLRLLVQLSESAPLGPDQDAVVAALQRHGTARALGELVDVFSRLEHWLRDRDRERSKLERARDKASRRGDHQEEQTAAAGVARLDKELASMRAWGQGIVVELAVFATEHGLEAPPTELVPASAWRRWQRKVASALPRG